MQSLNHWKKHKYNKYKTYKIIKKELKLIEKHVQHASLEDRIIGTGTLHSLDLLNLQSVQIF
jgi:hypothetical protein